MFSQVRNCAKPSALHVTKRSLASVQPPLDAPRLVEDYADKEHLPMFTISRARGFLPREDPLGELPRQFEKLERLLQKMTIHQRDGSTGLLGRNQFGDAVRDELVGDEAMISHVRRAINDKDQRLASALFRDYCFLASAYILEPVDYSFRQTGSYSEGRSVLPRSIAVPLSELASFLGHYPYMEYASSYALQNFKRFVTSSKNPGELGPIEDWSMENLGVIRAFENNEGSEAGFILVHVAMVAHTGKLVSHCEDILAACKADNRAAFEKGMEGLLDTYERINRVMDTMWSHSKPQDYLKFRSFIFGTGPAKLNTMFPEGVLYEGVNSEPMAFRGESGANDSIIPLNDNLLEITAEMPSNEFTSILREFRTYRPSAQREYIDTLEGRASSAGIRSYARGSPRSLALYMLLVDQNREFRERHWRFTKEYIIKRTDYSIATGGSPILQYLPHNLATVLRVLEQTADELSDADARAALDDELYEKTLMARTHAAVQRRQLDRDVQRLKDGVRGVDDRYRLKYKVLGEWVGNDGVG